MDRVNRGLFLFPLGSNNRARWCRVQYVGLVCSVCTSPTSARKNKPAAVNQPVIRRLCVLGAVRPISSRFRRSLCVLSLLLYGNEQKYGHHHRRELARSPDENTGRRRPAGSGRQSARIGFYSSVSHLLPWPRPLITVFSPGWLAVSRAEGGMNCLISPFNFHF